MKLGFFGGSFNPPTNAHIYMAKKVLSDCKLDKVIFVPMNDFYEKTGLAMAKDRLKMLQIACEDIDNIEVSDIEIRENKKLSAIEAFKLIKSAFCNDDVYFIMGADNFIKLSDWEQSTDLMKNFNYIVLERGDIDLDGFILKHKDLKMNILDIIENIEYRFSSASEFRSNLGFCSDLKSDMVPDNVLDFIVKNGIYLNS